MDQITFLEDVWQCERNCRACIEYFYRGLKIGNMIFMKYSVYFDGKFTPLCTKVIDVGIGLERIPWLVNSNCTSYLDVFSYVLLELSEKLKIDLNQKFFLILQNILLSLM
jgi:alanyl-tRNA synthetase